MQKGVAGKVGGETNDYRKNVAIGLMVLGAFFVVLVAIQALLPKESRACALMPGFCRQKDDKEKTPFQKLDDGFHTAPKFGLTSRG